MIINKNKLVKSKIVNFFIFEYKLNLVRGQTRQYIYYNSQLI